MQLSALGAQISAKFELFLSAFSVNAVYCRDRRWKTSAYKDWESRFCVQLRRPTVQAELTKVREAYEPGDTFAVKLTFYYKKFLNKERLVSAHTEDLSNVEKQVLDILFLPKFGVLPEPYGAPNVMQDDRYVVSLLSRKRANKDPEDKISVQIRLIKAKQP